MYNGSIQAYTADTHRHARVYSYTAYTALYRLYSYTAIHCIRYTTLYNTPLAETRSSEWTTPREEGKVRTDPL